MASALPVTVFSDFTCPFSYVTEAALRRAAERHPVEVRYRAFELYPAPSPAPPPGDEPGWDELQALAAELDLPLRAPSFRPRTRKAHEAYRFAAERGVGDPMRSALFSAYWAEERDIGRIDVLQSLIEPFGVDPEDLKIALDIDQHAAEVAADEALAAQLHLRAVPVLYLGTGRDARILMGAQSAAALDAALASR